MISLTTHDIARDLTFSWRVASPLQTMSTVDALDISEREIQLLAEACASRTHRRHQGCHPPVLKISRWVLIGSENSLLYSILCSFSRKGCSDAFCFVLICLTNGSITFLSQQNSLTLFRPSAPGESRFASDCLEPILQNHALSAVDKNNR